MFNGRNFKQNDYTYKDVAVFDNELISHEQLLLYCEFNVVRVNDLFEQPGCVRMYNPLRSLPDNIMLQLNLNLQQFQFVSQPLHTNITHTSPIADMKRYDLTRIPGNFLFG